MKKQMIYFSNYNMTKRWIHRCMSVVFLIMMSANMMVQGQFFGNNTDFLEQVFSPSKSQQQVINL